MLTQFCAVVRSEALRATASMRVQLLSWVTIGSELSVAPAGWLIQSTPATTTANTAMAVVMEARARAQGMRLSREIVMCLTVAHSTRPALFPQSGKEIQDGPWRASAQGRRYTRSAIRRPRTTMLDRSRSQGRPSRTRRDCPLGCAEECTTKGHRGRSRHRTGTTRGCHRTSRSRWKPRR